MTNYNTVHCNTCGNQVCQSCGCCASSNCESASCPDRSLPGVDSMQAPTGLAARQLEAAKKSVGQTVHSVLVGHNETGGVNNETW